MVEPHYEDDEELVPQHRPKWTKPTHKIEKLILESVGMKYYPDHQVRNSIKMIAKATMSLTTGIDSEFPEEWVRFCCSWCVGKRNERPPKPINLIGLVHFIQNADRKREWVVKWKAEHADQIKQDYTEELDANPKEDYSW